MAEGVAKTPGDDRVVLVRIVQYADEDGLMEVASSVSDHDLAAYLRQLAGVAARGEHRDH